MAGINSPNNLNGINPLAYVGTTASGPLSPPSLSVELRDPKSTPFGDYKNWNLGALWLNQVTQALWVLVAKGANYGTWVQFSGGSGAMLTLTGNTGGPVSPLAGNINVVGDGIGITIAGNPGTHTLTASLVGGTVVNSIMAGENINLGGTAAAPVINLNETIQWPNTTADGLHGAIYLGATCTGTVCSGGTIFMHNFGTSNTFLGSNAGNLTTSGSGSNTGIGTSALASITTANGCTALGSFALVSNTNANAATAIGAGALQLYTGSGSGNTAIGAQALGNSTAGSHQIAVGTVCMQNNSGDNNTALGYNAANQSTTASQNIFIGLGAASQGSGSDNKGTGLLTGTDNTVIGTNAGTAMSGAESSNIYLGRSVWGVTGESNAMRLGTSTLSGHGQILKTYIGGIAGVTTDVNDAVPVLISASTGQLGVTSSSIRYKENIKDLPGSQEIYNLRPVIFNYKNHSPESKSVGLIAEEVEKVMPQMVIYEKAEPETVKYNDLVLYLLAEIQNLNKRLKVLE